MKKAKIALAFLLVLVLLLGNVYFYIQSQKPDCEIWIGRACESQVPDQDSAQIGRTTGTDFTRSQPLPREEVNTLILAFIGARDYENAAISETLPDALMQLRMTNEGYACYYQINLWLKEDAVVFSIGTEDGSHYQQVTSPYYVEALTAIIQNQIGS